MQLRGNQPRLVGEDRHKMEPMPEYIEPMLAKPSQLPVLDRGYAYEVKWDGIRAIGFVKSGRLRLHSRNLLDMTMRYPELQALAASLSAQTLILDGEIV